MTRSRFCLIAAALALLGGCSDTGIFGSKIVPPTCPTARPLDEANHITVYRDGPGRDIADIVYEARIVSVDGDCSYEIDKKGKTAAETTYKSVTVNLRPRIIVTPGPAMTGYNITLDYFVAMPMFYPAPQGRADFTRTVETSAARTQVDVTEASIEIKIPVSQKRRGDSVAIFVGFNLNEEQLRENRTRSANRLFR